MDQNEIAKLRAEVARLQQEKDQISHVLNQLGDAAHIGYWEVDVATKEIFWSKKTHDLHGTDPQHPLSVEERMSHIPAIFHEDILRNFNRLITEGVPYTLDYQIIRNNDKEVRWVRASNKALYQNGKLVKAYGTFQDIHQEKCLALANEAQQVRLRMLESLVNSSPDIFAIATPKGEMLFLNKTARDYGWSEEKSFGDIFPVESIAMYLNDIYPILKTKGRWDGETLFKDSTTDEIFPVKQRSFLLRDTHGRTHAVATIATDIREQRKLEAEMEQNQIKLVQASKMTSLGEMAGGMAHEINNPLAIIKGNVALMDLHLADSQVDPQQLRQSIRTIDQTVDRIAAIIKALRSFAKDGSGDPITLVYLESLVENTLGFFRNRIASAGVKLTVNSPQGDVAVTGRKSQLGQALANLISNAFEAAKVSENPEIIIEIGQDHTSTQLRVRDSGPGVPVNLREKILEPFFTTRETGQGTGLGLPVAKALVETNDGHLYLDTSARRTTFIMEFPLS